MHRLHSSNRKVPLRFDAGKLIAFTLLALLPLSIQPTPSTPIEQLTLETPRPFGYMIGDFISHKVLLTVAKPFRLEPEFLPQQGAINQWLDLDEIRFEAHEQESTISYSIFLSYQIFSGAKESEELVIPGFPIRFHNETQSLTANTPDWRFANSPLIPPNTSDKEISIQPPASPPLIPILIHKWILGILIGGIALILLTIAWRKDLLPFLNPHPGPFARACRELKQFQSASTDSLDYRSALQSVHQAFNETAGETLFADQLDGFYHRNPRFNSLRNGTEAFFRISRQTFFEQPEELDSKDYPIQWIEKLCREYRKIERVF